MPTISPDNNFKLIFDFTVLTFLILNIVHVPMSFAFSILQENYNQIAFIILEKMPPYVFLIEIFFNFNTSYYSKGELISDKGKIIRHYLKTKFILDLVTIIPFLSGRFIQNKVLQLFLLIRGAKLKKMIDILEECLELRTFTKGIFDLTKLIFFIFYIAHLFGCLWHYIAFLEFEHGEKNTWLVALGINEKNWETR